MTGDEEMIIHKMNILKRFSLFPHDLNQDLRGISFIKRAGMRGNEDKCENNLSRNSLLLII